MKLLKKISFKMIILILIFLIINLMYTPKLVFASDGSNGENTDQTSLTVESARQNIANFALQFQSEHSGNCDYDGNWSFETIKQKRLNTYRTSDVDGKTYEFDCVGWVTFAINRATGMECTDPGGSGFITPGGIRDSRFEEVSISEIQAGDILWIPGEHVAIYAGNGQVVDMWQTRVGSRNKPNGGLKVRSLDGYYTYTNAARLVSVDGAHFTPIGDGSNLPEGSTEEGFDREEVDLDEIADQFTFDGMPTTVIYEEQVDVFTWIFDGIAGIMDYIAGLIIYLIKAPILGYVSIFQRFVNSFLHDLN